MGYLQTYLDDGDAFARWVMHFPSLAVQVEQYLIVASANRESTSVVDLCAGRDAVNSLRVIALDAGFRDVAAAFEVTYEEYASRLMPFLSGGV